LISARLIGARTFPAAASLTMAPSTTLPEHGPHRAAPGRSADARRGQVSDAFGITVSPQASGMAMARPARTIRPASARRLPVPTPTLDCLDRRHLLFPSSDAGRDSPVCPFSRRWAQRSSGRSERSRTCPPT